MAQSTPSPSDNQMDPTLSFEGKRYDLNMLPKEVKELVRGMQIADTQLRMHEDTLKVLAVGRQSMAMQLKEKLKGVNPIGWNLGAYKYIILTNTFANSRYKCAKITIQIILSFYPGIFSIRRQFEVVYWENNYKNIGLEILTTFVP